jgi:hypothetical protein
MTVQIYRRRKRVTPLKPRVEQLSLPAIEPDDAADTITLTRDEIRKCRRWAEEKAELFDDAVATHVVGFFGEAAVAIRLNVRYTPVIGPDGGTDIGGHVQVKATSNALHKLTIAGGSRGDQYYVFVRVFGERCRIVGWIYGEELLTHAEWWNRLLKAYEIPDAALAKMHELPLTEMPFC